MKWPFKFKKKYGKKTAKRYRINKKREVITFDMFQMSEETTGIYVCQNQFSSFQAMNDYIQKELEKKEVQDGAKLHLY